jgi:hypothetical protein
MSGIALGQSDKIKVRKGDRFTYKVQAEMEFTEMSGEREDMMRVETGGPAELQARKVSKKSIEWSYDSPDVRLQRSQSTVDREHSTDTTIAGKQQNFTTDAVGNMRGGKTSTQSISTGTLSESIHKNVVKQWFLPKIFRKLKPGDTWQENFDDQVTINELGLNVRTQYTVIYTFDGIVDTLGTKAMRIRSHAASMKIAGKRSVAGNSMPVEGDGDHYGTAYYSTIDGLLLVSNSENQLDMHVASSQSPGSRIIPMTWRLKAEAVRQ